MYQDDRHGLYESLTSPISPPLCLQYWRYVRLLSQSLYLFWNHLERAGAEESFGKKQMHVLVKRLGIVSVSEVNKRPRSRSRSRSRAHSISTIDHHEEGVSKMNDYMFVDENDDTREERREKYEFLADLTTSIEDAFKRLRR
jgi:hypothetical protein